MMREVLSALFGFGLLACALGFVAVAVVAGTVLQRKRPRANGANTSAREEGTDE